MMARGSPSKSSALRTRLKIVCWVATGGIAIVIGVFVGILLWTFSQADIYSHYPDSTPNPTPTGTLSPTPPAPIIDSSATVVIGDAVTLEWSAVAGASKYRIGYEGYEDPPYAGFTWGFAETKSTRHTVEGLTPGVVYTFGIAAYGDGVRYSRDWSRSTAVEVRIPPDDDMSEEGGAGSDE